MRVLVDRHHHDLFYSLQRLFGDRLGMQVYTPVGHDWWDQGYWRFGEGYGDDRLAQQFLSTDRPGEWTDRLGLQQPGYRTFRGKDNHHPEREILGVELGAVLNTSSEWGYVVASVQDNQRGFARLARELGATYVLQVGNTRQDVDWSLNPLALVSSEVPIEGRGIRYHQEFDTDTFRYFEPGPSQVIRSFVNCFGSTPCGRGLEAIRPMLPGWQFGVHGIDGPDGNVETVQKLAMLMADAAFGWHDKVQGDGFGHVIHQWAAIGRPIIGHAQHYRGLMAERFWQDGVTCIDLDRHSLTETAELVRDIVADPPRHRAMCEAIRAEFDAIDYDAEAAAIRDLLIPQAVAA